MSRILVQIIGSMQLAQVHASRHVRKHQNICDGSSEAGVIYLPLSEAMLCF